MASHGPDGHLLIEVDDIASHGTQVHADKMQQLRSTLKFGKWKSIYNGEGDYAGRTIKQLSDYSFHLHQAKFVKERLTAIDIAKGRRSNKKAATSPGEKSQLRAVLGSCNWVQRETRPDASALTSLCMSRINESTVQDLVDANECVRVLKQNPHLGIVIPHIAPKELRWASIQDASWANAAQNHSQIGFLVGATTQALWLNQAAPFAMISHRSHGAKRKVSSTLAAEAQSMSEALAECEWLRGFYEELVNPEFDIVQWSAKTRHRGLLCAARSADPDRSLEQLLCICDAKSLYDHLRNETSGTTSDRRTAIEIQIIRSSLDAQGGQVRWVDHSGMYADAMTKRGGNIPLLQTLMKTGRIAITKESTALEQMRRGSSSKTYTDPAADNATASTRASE